MISIMYKINYINLIKEGDDGDMKNDDWSWVDIKFGVERELFDRLQLWMNKQDVKFQDIGEAIRYCISSCMNEEVHERVWRSAGFVEGFATASGKPVDLVFDDALKLLK